MARVQTQELAALGEAKARASEAGVLGLGTKGGSENEGLFWGVYMAWGEYLNNGKSHGKNMENGIIFVVHRM